jgi:hypothetical protein
MLPKGVCGNIPQLLVKNYTVGKLAEDSLSFRVSANYSAGIMNFIK